MNELELLDSTFETEQKLPIFEGLRAGFPSPAADYEQQTLDFNRDFIKHPEATFFGRVKGDSMREVGITEGDFLVVDKAAEINHGDIVVAYFNREFTIKFLDATHREEGWMELVPANPSYKRIHIDVNDEFVVWGKVIFTIKDWRAMPCMP